MGGGGEIVYYPVFTRVREGVGERQTDRQTESLNFRSEGQRKAEQKEHELGLTLLVRDRWPKYKCYFKIFSPAVNYAAATMPRVLFVDSVFFWR